MPLSEYYNGYRDNAVTEMASRAFDYNTLIRKVVGQMTASGLRSVDYASGHSNRVDVAARRALLTGMGQLTGHISDSNGTALGTDLFEVDWHSGARPDHAVWQGRVWSKQQLRDVCGLGSGSGLLGWNCRHTYYPFIKGISQRTYKQWQAEQAMKKAARAQTAQKKVVKDGKFGIIKENGGILKMDLQFFAEKDIKNQESNSLKRAIRKYRARIEEHQAKLDDPSKFFPEWDNFDPRYQEGLKRHWNKEISNFKKSIQDRIDELKKRGDHDE